MAHRYITLESFFEFVVVFAGSTLAHFSDTRGKCTRHTSPATRCKGTSITAIKSKIRYHLVCCSSHGTEPPCAQLRSLSGRIPTCQLHCMGHQKVRGGQEEYGCKQQSKVPHTGSHGAATAKSSCTCRVTQSATYWCHSYQSEIKRCHITDIYGTLQVPVV